MKGITWQPELIEISKLKETPINPKIKSEQGVKRLQKSLARFGLAGSIVCNKDLTIIDGNSRLAEIKPGKEKKVWVSLPDRQLTETEFTAMNALFDLSKAGEPDLLLIEDIIGEELFQEFELESEKKPEIVEDEFNAAPPKNPITKLGDIYELNSHRVQCGDSTDTEVVKKTLDGNCPILMVTDPPYGVNYDADWRNRTDRANGKPYGARAIGKV